MKQLLRYAETLYHLRSSQIFWQVVRRAQKQIESPESLVRLEPSESQFRLSLESFSDPPRPPVPPQPREDLLQWKFRFLNRTEELPAGTLRWEAKAQPKLWQYNLHYFDWLWSLDADQDSHWDFARSAVLDWIVHHPPGKTAHGWEPYPTSLRLINWSLLFLHRWIERTKEDKAFVDELSRSLYRQLIWLEKHLEYHIQANHLLENAVALVVASRYAEGTIAEKLRRLGNRIASQQIQEQILADGMHYERSPMYHARALWLAELLGSHAYSKLANHCQSVQASMNHALDNLRHSDGSLALFNDAANGIYSLPEQRNENDISNNQDVPRLSTLRAWAMEDSGFFGAKCRRENRYIDDSIACNCGSLSPSYQPGHAHADTFTFEWFLSGKPFITDTGVMEYMSGSNREWERSTAAHNTVQVNHRNSSDVWSSFRVGRRAKVSNRRWESSEKGFTLSARHNGYRPWQHVRTFDYNGDHLRIIDRLSGHGTTLATWTFHFGPSVELSRVGNCIVATLEDERIEIEMQGFPEDFRLDIGTSRYSPEFGKAIQRRCIVIEAAVDQLLETTVAMKVKT